MTSTSEKLETIHAVSADLDAVFTWDYERSRPALVKLYEKAKTSQWNATTDLDWSIDVDPEKIGQELGGGGTMRFQALARRRDSPVKNFGDKEWLQISRRVQNWLLSQFMHGEQGALLCTAKIVETVPCMNCDSVQFWISTPTWRHSLSPKCLTGESSASASAWKRSCHRRRAPDRSSPGRRRSTSRGRSSRSTATSSPSRTASPSAGRLRS